MEIFCNFYTITIRDIFKICQRQCKGVNFKCYKLHQDFKLNSISQFLITNQRFFFKLIKLSDPPSSGSTLFRLTQFFL